MQSVFSASHCAYMSLRERSCLQQEPKQQHDMKLTSPHSKHPILHLLQRCKTIETIKKIHAQMITTALIHHTYPLSQLLHVSSTLSPLSYALTIFNQVLNPTIFLFNTLITSLAKTNTESALSLYTTIFTKTKLEPNNYTYPSLFKVCGSHPWLEHGRALHTHVLKFLEPPYDHFVHASLLNFYSKCGKVSICRYFFDRISQPDLATWNSILSAYARNASMIFESNANNFDDSTSLSLEVLHLFSKMQESFVRPNEVTLVALITACADLGAVNLGTWAHAYVIKNNLSINQFIGSALITMYANCGCLSLACQLFDQLPLRDKICYNAMIRGLAINGQGMKALDLFKRMDQEGLMPDDVTILAVMCACSHIGLVDQGCKYFKSMTKDYGIEPRLEHYCCLVDLLGRAGRVKEAQDTILTMPMRPNAILWRSLLGAARVHQNLHVGEIALKNLIQLETKTSGNYVLLSNIYASMSRWDDVKRIRKSMKLHGVNKLPGISIAEVNGAMHEFLIGDKTHSHSNEIYTKLEEMNIRLQERGHMPTTREVLFDIEEEEKEDALTYHSERLAIAFALLEGCSKGPIRIIKNLRVCSDCHEWTKLISSINDREIIVRDRIRFHHFQDGTCSCLDYW